MKIFFKTLFLFCIATTTTSLMGSGSVFAQVNMTEETITSNVGLVWEAETYTPPFYKGKALLPDGAEVKLIALPPTGFGDSSLLNFTWRVDGDVVDTASGVGRSFFVYQGGLFGGSPLIVVEVSQGEQKVGVGAIRVPLVKPRVLLYPALPLAGILFGSQVRSVQGEEMTIETYPLFFSVEKKSDPSLTYQWKVNDEFTPNPLGAVSRIVVRGESAGSATLGVSINNTQNMLEAAEGNITLSFEE